jgi:aminoglycoside phosphotransferase (APT) family kinase protein
VNRLLSLPVTLIHGEFYASNIIIQHETDALRVCPVDWETTAIGPGLVDVAAITGGTWSEPEQLALTEAYQRARTGIATSGPVWRELLESLDYCLLHTAVKNVGWSDDENWTPPPQHAYTWLQDVIRLSRKLGL